MIRGAIFSEDGEFRYELTRVWDESLPMLMWIMLNPSVASTECDDPTVRKCVGFGKRLGYGGILVGNLYAYVATCPKELARRWKAGLEIQGPDNDERLRGMACRADRIIAAWGSAPIAQRREARVTYLLRDATVPDSKLHALKETAGGSPCHPLYLPYHLTPQPWPRDA